MSELNKYGIGFWAGACVYSIINLIMNLKQVAQSEVLTYNYLITIVAVFGLALNTYLLKKGKNKYSDSMKLNKKSTIMIILGMVVTIIIADLIIHALIPVPATAFNYRLIANICIVIMFAGTWFKMNKARKVA